MPQITFLPMNRVCDAGPGESILNVALLNEIPICHACGGFCACTTCQVDVISGAENLSPMMDDEIERLETTADTPSDRSRLGCQALIQGDVTVKIRHLDSVD